MPAFRKKPVVIEAVQWFKNGDHPDDKATEMFDYPDADGQVFQRPRVIREGAVVRYFRRPDVKGHEGCHYCTHTLHDHGWIDTLEGGHIVCPGDWIITGVKGERYPCKPDIFAATYDAEPTSGKMDRSIVLHVIVSEEDIALIRQLGLSEWALSPDVSDAQHVAGSSGAAIISGLWNALYNNLPPAPPAP